MASVRQLKKEVDNELLEVISDCFLYAGLHPDSNVADINDIIEDAVKLRNDLIERANNPVRGEADGVAKKHFQAIRMDLRTGSENLCGRLSEISKKKK